jgi:hypothetical protein
MSMNAPTAATVDELRRLEEALEAKTAHHDIVHMIKGDHPEHGVVIIIRDETQGYFFTIPIPDDAK